MTPQVSIVVPAFNAARTLAATLDSALSQNAPAEIVVVDDGSTDDTLAVARRYEPRVRVLTGPNGGVSAARNRGVSRTSAPWLLFLDSDDILTPNTLMERLEVGASEGSAVVICEWEDFDDESGLTLRRRRVDWEFLRRDPQLASATSVWATTAALLYRRDLVERIGGFRQYMPVIEDARFLFDAAKAGAQFGECAALGARYRVAAGSLSRRRLDLFWLNVLRNGMEIEAIWRADDALSPERLQGLADIYNNSARGLFSAAHPGYFQAVFRQRALGLPLPRHSRLGPPVARLFGLRAARALATAAGAA